MADLKPAYLIHGDDHGAVGERRAGLRKLAEGRRWRRGAGGRAGDPRRRGRGAGHDDALGGRRVIIVDGAERWREGEVEEQLAPALAAMPADTTLAIFAREEARAKAPRRCTTPSRRPAGRSSPQMTVKPWELPKWAREQAARLGLALDAAAAKALVAQVGERQQRLLRELEKLALEGEPDARGAADGQRRGDRGARRALGRAPGLRTR